MRLEAVVLCFLLITTTQRWRWWGSTAILGGGGGVKVNKLLNYITTKFEVERVKIGSRVSIRVKREMQGGGAFFVLSLWVAVALIAFWKELRRVTNYMQVETHLLHQLAKKLYS